MKRSGFTLIELSIVLIIIGLIIGGVMKGRDLINSASQKKVYNTWVKQWQVAISQYEDRTGAVLGDGTANGGKTDPENGFMDYFYLKDQPDKVQTALTNVGLTVPTSNIVDSNGSQYRIKGKYVTNVSNLYFGTANGKNVMMMSGMPTDVAIAFDKIVDGAIDPLHGNFRNWSDRTTTTWPSASTTRTVNAYLVTE